MTRRENDEQREELLHIRVRPSTKRHVAEMAYREDRKMSDMGSILIEEAVAARSRKRGKR